MNFEEFEKLISTIRLEKYKTACYHNKIKTLQLYRANSRLSAAFLAVLGMFEVVLRNKIDSHYKLLYPAAGGHEWLLTSALPGGFLSGRNCYNSAKKITEAYTYLGIDYTHDKLLAKLSFGFWKYLFKGFQFMAGGNTLLSIFPYLPARTNQSDVYAKLDKINALRNRVAHHEPICFGHGNVISTVYARSHFQEIMDILSWMGIDGRQLFLGVDGVLREADYIDHI